jgi:hypothetical protein
MVRRLSGAFSSARTGQTALTPYNMLSVATKPTADDLTIADLLLVV